MAAPLNAASPMSPMPFRQGFVQRTFSPLTAGGVRQSAFTLISTAMGGGVLCIPYVMDQVGWMLGCFLLLTSAIIAYGTMYILIISATRTGKYSYGSLLAHCTGSWSAPVLDLVMATYGFGALVAYFIFLGDFLPSLATAFGAPECFRQRNSMMLLAAVLALPMCLPRRLSALQYVSPIATLSLVFTAVAVVIQAPYYHAALPPNSEPAEPIHFGLQVLKSFSICLFAYICHLNVVPVAGELVDPSPQRVAKICGRVSGVLFVFYALIGVCGYLSFSDETRQNFITNYPTENKLVVACRVLLSLSLLFCIPININPTAKAMVHFLETTVLSRSSPSSTRAPLLGVSSREERKALRLSLTLFFLVSTLGTAVVVPGVADVLSLLGGSLGTLLMITAPCVIFIRAMPRESERLAGKLIVGSLLSATSLAVVALAAMVLNFMGLMVLDRHLRDSVWH